MCSYQFLRGPHRPESIVIKNSKIGETYLKKLRKPSSLDEALIGMKDRQFRDFGPPTAELRDGLVERSHAVDLKLVAMSDFFRLLLTEAVGAQDRGPSDKISWDLRFAFKGLPCGLRLGKSGLKLSFCSKPDPAEGVADAELIVEKLKAGVRFLQNNVVAPLVQEQLAQNRVTVANQHDRQQAYVDYFTHKLRTLIHPTGTEMLEERTGQETDAIPASAIYRVLDGMQREQDLVHEISHCGIALVGGYFALVQYRLVLLSAFTIAALSPDFSLEKFREKKWREQFDSIFPDSQDAYAQQARKQLITLSNDYRNPLLHGGDGRPSEGTFVEWAPGYNVLVGSEKGATDQYMLWMPSLTKAQVTEILDGIELIDGWFHTLPYFDWVQRGLPVNFHPESVRTAIDHLAHGTHDEYTNRAEVQYEQMINHD